MQDTDRLGRPVIVVTGIGLVTSLGQGVEANWTALTAGVCGIERISRFSVANMKTAIAGTVDFVPVEDMSAPALSERLAELVVEEAMVGAGIGGDFPGPLFLALPPVELEWPQRQALAAESDAGDTVTYADLLRAAGSGNRRQIYQRFLLFYLLIKRIGIHLSLDLTLSSSFS